MVAFIPVASLWMVGLLITSQFVKPRLPAYSFGIRSMWPSWSGKAKLGAAVWLRNDNYVPIDIYALGCDVYYPDWQGSLNHIGNVQDTQQVELASGALACRGGGDANSGSSSKTCEEPKKQALWKIQSRHTFEKDDHVYMQPVSMSFGTLTSLLYDMIRQFGKVNVPSSMTVQVKANKKIPVTMSILCDNELNIWSLEMVGITCELDNFLLGWVNMTAQVERLRTKTIEGHQPELRDGDGSGRTSSIVGRKPEPPNFHDEFEKANRKTIWQDVPLLEYFTSQKADMS